LPLFCVRSPNQNRRGDSRSQPRPHLRGLLRAQGRRTLRACVL